MVIIYANANVNISLNTHILKGPILLLVHTRKETNNHLRGLVAVHFHCNRGKTFLTYYILFPCKAFSYKGS